MKLTILCVFVVMSAAVALVPARDFNDVENFGIGKPRLPPKLNNPFWISLDSEFERCMERLNLTPTERAKVIRNAMGLLHAMIIYRKSFPTRLEQVVGKKRAKLFNTCDFRKSGDDR